MSLSQPSPTHWHRPTDKPTNICKQAKTKCAFSVTLSRPAIDSMINDLTVAKRAGLHHAIRRTCFARARTRACTSARYLRMCVRGHHSCRCIDLSEVNPAGPKFVTRSASEFCCVPPGRCWAVPWMNEVTADCVTRRSAEYHCFSNMN